MCRAHVSKCFGIPLSRADAVQVLEAPESPEALEALDALAALEASAALVEALVEALAVAAPRVGASFNFQCRCIGCWCEGGTGSSCAFLSKSVR
jgi:hypothetical protein